jgi:hypothetical protein
MAATYYNLSDPKRAEIYARLMSEKPYELENNLVFVMDGWYFKVPLPPGVNKFANPFRNYVESQYIGDQQGFMQSAYDTLIAPFNPLGDTKSQFLGNFVPQYAKPLVEETANYSFLTGKESIPDDMRLLPKEEQKYKNTPQIFIDIAEKLNTSPLFVQNMIRGYTAGGGEGAVANISLIRDEETGGRSTPEQIVGGFYKGSVPSGVHSKFYNGEYGFETLKVLKDRDSKFITESIIKDYNSPEADKKAVEYNARVDEAIRRLKEDYGKFETGEDIKIKLEQLENLKLPLENGRLTSRSKDSRIKSRQ